MKITGIDLITSPFGKESSTQYVVTRVLTDEGIYGLGEAHADIPGGAEALTEMLSDYAPLLVGRNPLDHAVIWDQLFRGTFWAMSSGPVVTGAISALDTSLWDIRAKAMGVPLWKAMGGRYRDRLPVCVASEDPVSFAGKGFPAVKAKLSRLADVRDAVGEAQDIVAEAAGRIDIECVNRFAEGAENCQLRLLENPCLPISPDQYKRAAERTRVPLAGGRLNYTRWGFMPFFRNGSLSTAVLDIGCCGGVTEFLRIEEMAQIYGIDIMTCAGAGVIGEAVALHCGAAAKNYFMHEWNADLDRSAAVCSYLPEDGFIPVPDTPGIGQDFSEEALSEAQIRSVR